MAEKFTPKMATNIEGLEPAERVGWGPSQEALDYFSQLRDRLRRNNQPSETHFSVCPNENGDGTMVVKVTGRIGPRIETKIFPATYSPLSRNGNK